MVEVRNIECNSGIMHGKPVIADTRFPISSLLAELAGGEESLKAICDDFDLNFETTCAVMHELACMFEPTHPLWQKLPELEDQQKTKTLKVEVPVQKFPLGSVVELPNTTNEKSLFLWVKDYEVEGDWQEKNSKGFTGVRIKDRTYTVASQEGSFYNTGNNPQPMRPGTALVYEADELEARGKVIEYKEELVEIDTSETIHGRWEKWKEVGSA
jgi:uncharacterized protein (DUF433 family)